MLVLLGLKAVVRGVKTIIFRAQQEKMQRGQCPHAFAKTPHDQAHCCGC
jgi:hypothetical protein